MKQRFLLSALAAVIVSSQPVFAQNLQSSSSTPSVSAVVLRIIVVSSEEKAQHVLDELKHGDDFAALAKKQSIDSTADEGGFMGKVALSMLRPEFQAAVQGLSPGQLSQVVRSPLGFAILKIEHETVVTSGPGSLGTVTQAAAATGSVKYAYTIGGLGLVETGLINRANPDEWDHDPRLICQARKESLALMKDSLEELFSPAHQADVATQSPFDVMNEHFGLGELHSYHGDMDGAIEQYNIMAQMAESDAPAAMLQANEALGIAYLHKSEMENDVYLKPGDRCLLPMQPGNAYQNKSDSEKAIEYFLKYLEEKPNELEVRWLLNLTYMTLGEYPDKVPQKYLIPPSSFESAENVGRFVDVAPQAGLDIFSMAGGVIVDDLENNGRFDIVKSSFDACAPMRFFHNNGDGTFTEQAEKAGLADQLGGLNIIQTDFNNDGCTDILVLRGGWEVPMPKSLLRNNCDGTFTDVTADSGLAVTSTSTQAGVWIDINNDGLLDLFVGNENGPAQLFLNKGNGKFEDISNSAGISRTAFTKGVTAADYDNDGYPDLFVSNLTGDNFLYHNNHDNTFTEVAEQAGVQGPARGFATWFFDYDNDGWPDLFVTSYFVSVDETARTYLGLPHNATTLKLYKNMGNGTFRDVTTEVGLNKVFMPMGANFGDIDNDGFLDIYLGTGNPSYASLIPNVLLRNHDGKYFVDVTASSGTGELHKGHGIAFADLDNDGDEDIIAEVGGATPGDSHAMRIFENPGNGNDWIALKLVGAKTNRAAIGARIKVTLENQGQETRSIYRTVGSGGSFGSSPLQQHIGLGKSAKILDVEIWWPTSNTRQHFSDLGKNQVVEIKEFSQNYARLERQPYRLGGAKRETTMVARPAEPNAEKNK